MDYEDTSLGSTRPLKAQRGDSVAVNISTKEIISCKPVEPDLANDQELGNLNGTSNEPAPGAMHGQGSLGGCAAGVLQQSVTAPARGPLAVEIKHPLAAIAANANAATRWLKRPDANLAEALAALDRIVKDCIQIDAIVDGINAMIAEESRQMSVRGPAFRVTST